ncbi:MAG TPA: YbaN family protein [Enterococcus sp.]|nr:YbaN family protein [Enterococcus sp.]
MKKVFYLTLGCASLGLGAAGTVLPVLPTVPFLLLATYSFAKGSERMHQWFIQTSLYEKHLATFVNGQGMSRQTKRRAMITVTLTMGFSFLMVYQHPLLQLMLAGIWCCLMLYFIFKIKTIA